MPTGWTADAGRTSRRRRSAGLLTPPRSAVRAEPLFCRSYPPAVAGWSEIRAFEVVFAPLSGRSDVHTERVFLGDDKTLIAYIIDKYFYNQMSWSGNQPRGWTQAAPDKGALLETLHRLRLFRKIVVNS